MGPLGARYTMPHTRARLGTQHRAHSPVPRLQTQGVHHRTHVTRTQHQAHTLGRKHWPHTGPHSRPTRVDPHAKHASPNTQHQHHNTGTQSQAYNDSPASWAHMIGTHPHTHRGHAWHPQQEQKLTLCQLHMARAYASNTHQTHTPQHSAMRTLWGT